MKLLTKIGSFYTAVGGATFAISQKNGMLFSLKRPLVRTTAGQPAELEAQAELTQLRLLETKVLLQGSPVSQRKTVWDLSVTDYILPFS